MNEQNEAARPRHGALRWIIAAIVIVAGSAVVWDKVLEDRLIPKRWGVVEDGSLYRSGQLHPALVARTLESNEIDLVVSLIDTDPAQTDDEDRRFDEAEREACRALGIERRVFPLLGDGTGDIESYVSAIATMSEAAHNGRRVLIHCSAGSQRTGGAVAAYRVLIQGWDSVRARAEMELYDWDPTDDTAVLSHLDSHMGELTRKLVAVGVLEVVPDPLPVLRP